jgi:hypothetical protein
LTTTTATGTRRIDWVELSTPDIEEASDFYATVLDWSYTSLGTRKLAEVGNGKGAGLAPRIPTIGDMPLPAAWMIFIRTEDLPGTLQRAIDLGGVVVDRPQGLPEGWTTAVVIDPAGASFGLVQGSSDFGFGTSSEATSPIWCDLMTRDGAAAERFYNQLFGWMAEFDPETRYTAFTLDGERVAGMLDMPPQVPAGVPSNWLPYFLVDDVDAVSERAAEAGGTIDVAPTAVDSVVFAVVEDSAGAVFGLLETKEIRKGSEAPGQRPSVSRHWLASLLREGNRRHIILHDRSGRQMVDLPLNVAVGGALVAPYAMAAGGLAALLAGWRVSMRTPTQQQAGESHG